MFSVIVSGFIMGFSAPVTSHAVTCLTSAVSACRHRCGIPGKVTARCKARSARRPQRPGRVGDDFHDGVIALLRNAQRDEIGLYDGYTAVVSNSSTVPSPRW